MKRRMRVAAVAAILALAVSGLKAGPNINFTIHPLSDNPPWSSMYVFDMNARGTVAGEGRYDDGSDDYWTAWTSLSGAVTTGVERTAAYDINGYNDLVGWRWPNGPNDYERPAYWSFGAGGLYTEHHMQDGAYNRGQARGLNDAGQIVGFIQVHPAGVNHAVLWSDKSVIPQDLGVLDTTATDPTARTSLAEDINAAGQVVGLAEYSSGVNHAFLWSESGGMENLGCLGNWWNNSHAMAINDHEEVVGHQTEGHWAWKWTRANGMQALTKPPGCSSSQAFDINNDGLIVGEAGGAPGGGWLYMSGQPYLLDGLLTADDAGWHILEAKAINDAWHIAGYALDPAGGIHTVLLAPTTVSLPTRNADFGSTPGGLPEGWTASGDGTATTVVDPADPANVCAQLTTGSPVVLSQLIDTPAGPFYVVFDYQFITTTGTLDVLLDGTSIGTLDAPDPATGTWDTENLVVDDDALKDLTQVPLSFELDGPTGSQVLLDNVTLMAITPEPATLGLLAAGALAALVRRRRA